MGKKKPKNPRSPSDNRLSFLFLMLLLLSRLICNTENLGKKT